MVFAGCHMSYCPSTCPNYIPENTTHYCSICGNGIYNGEEYIRNDDGDYAHWECITGKKDLAEWLNYCLLYTSPSPRDDTLSRMPSSA